jgi:hypothetical protein
MPSFKEEFLSLLNCSETKEGAVQRYLERHPALVTGTDFVSPKVVVSQLRLGADHIADLAYVNPHSGPSFLRLIEIEDPHKPIFENNRQFQFHKDFNWALQQVHDWLRWCGDNHSFLQEFYRLIADQYNVDQSILTPRGILVYGRRSHLEGSVIKQDRWRQKVDSEKFVDVMTFDDFIERADYFFQQNNDTEYCPPTCVSYQQRRFVPKQIPEIYKL